jgi:hypothetical protein
MKKHIQVLITILYSAIASAQFTTLSENTIEPISVYHSIEKINGKKALRVVKDSAVTLFDEPTFIRLKGIELHNGTIEVKVLSKILKGAPELARGFIGIAFHINTDNTRFEGIYVRPSNARELDQLRRNHSIQYFSYPNFKFQESRKSATGQYEAYADMELDKWIKLKIRIQNQQAMLYLDDNSQPALIVNDLKLGADASGAIGLWVDIGTEGFFRDLVITKE